MVVDDSSKPSPIIRNKNFLLVYFVLNLALVWTVGITLGLARDVIPMLSFPWTFRIPSSDAKFNMTNASEVITTMYKANRDTSAQNLEKMLQTSLSMAGCKHAIQDGQLQWRQSEISPTCNCLRNHHVAYVAATHPALLDLQTKLSEEEEMKLQAIRDATHKKCFEWVRHTQVSLVKTFVFAISTHV